MHQCVVMRTLAKLSLFTLAPALLLTPAGARAQAVYPPPQQNGLPTQEGYAPPTQEQVNAADPYETPADSAQIDWPQDVVPEEAAVDSYDDGYDPQAYSQFQDELAPYGDWVDDSSYGRVWVPASTLVGSDFTPYYSGGHWLLTEFGWTWVSDWSWGWAPFHYGRWVIVSGFGWCWVPGTMWGPAWVTWRSGGGWVGWAALPPRGVSVTVTYGQRSPWRFTRTADLGAPRPRCVPMQEMRGLFRRTTIVANDRVLTRGNTTVHINAGPKYIPNATPVRLNAVAPQAFPQRAILPRPGAGMAQRPWIRAANDAVTSPGAARPGAGRVVGHVAGRGFSTRISSSAPPQIYNPPRTFASTAAPVHGAPHSFGSQAFGSAAPVSGTPHAFNPPPASVGPRVYDHPAPAYGAPGAFGAPDRNPVRVYSPPPRTFANSPAVNPVRAGFASQPAYSAPRTMAPAPAHTSAPAPAHTFAPPAPAFHQSFTAPSHSFGGPAAGGGGFGHANGGAHFGGGLRR
jgi:hypothetical protein